MSVVLAMAWTMEATTVPLPATLHARMIANLTLPATIQTATVAPVQTVRVVEAGEGSKWRIVWMIFNKLKVLQQKCTQWIRIKTLVLCNLHITSPLSKVLMNSTLFEDDDVRQILMQFLRRIS